MYRELLLASQNPFVLHRGLVEKRLLRRGVGDWGGGVEGDPVRSRKGEERTQVDSLPFLVGNPVRSHELGAHIVHGWILFSYFASITSGF